MTKKIIAMNTKDKKTFKMMKMVLWKTIISNHQIIIKNVDRFKLSNLNRKMLVNNNHLLCGLAN